MKSKLNIFLIFLLLGSSSATFAQGKIDLSGVFVDGLTGEYLPTKIIAYVQGQAFEVGSTDTSNKYYFQITTRIEEIEFQSEGYKTVKLPVIFHGKFERFSKAEISIQTFKRKARFRTEDLVIFCYSTDFCKDKEYEWHVLDSTGYSVRINFGNSFKNDTNSVSVKRTLEYLPQGKFEIRDSSSVLESRIY